MIQTLVVDDTAKLVGDCDNGAPGLGASRLCQAGRKPSSGTATAAMPGVAAWLQDADMYDVQHSRAAWTLQVAMQAVTAGQ